MAEKITFSGFPKETLTFYRNLERHNNRTWFEAHKQVYLDRVLQPAHDFVLALGRKLQTLSPFIGYDAQTGGRGSIHRIYRDVRFSQDKTPYKVNLGILFWMGERKKTSVTPGFWFHLDKDGAQIYSGMYEFSPEELRAFRETVADGKKGADLKRRIAALEKNRGFSTGGEFYKRVPHGFDPQHPRADLLRYSALYAMGPLIKPAVVASPKLLDACYTQCRVMLGLNEWLMHFKQSAG
jgi:uncharacterized protein (TIGR02453 family)